MAWKWSSAKSQPAQKQQQGQPEQLLAPARSQGFNTHCVSMLLRLASALDPRRHTGP